MVAVMSCTCYGYNSFAENVIQSSSLMLVNSECNSFTEPGVNKIKLSDEQVGYLLVQTNSSGISAILRTFNQCVDQAAMISGYQNLDQVSEKILNQLKYSVSYTGNELVEYVNYVVNIMLFTRSE